MQNWFRAKHIALKSPDAARSDVLVSMFYEQHKNFIAAKDINFRKVPTLKTLSAHALLRSGTAAQLPKEMNALIRDIDYFERQSFQMN